MVYANIEMTENGHLAKIEVWTEKIAREIAVAGCIAELSDCHWNLINFLRDAYINNSANQPNERNMVKAMSSMWDAKASIGELYELFPKQPSKQAASIAGLPESRRKGG
jgi:tRNA 2-thiouridine synthesizing protein E